RSAWAGSSAVCDDPVGVCVRVGGDGAEGGEAVSTAQPNNRLTPASRYRKCLPAVIHSFMVSLLVMICRDLVIVQSRLPNIVSNTYASDRHACSGGMSNAMRQHAGGTARRARGELSDPKDAPEPEDSGACCRLRLRTARYRRLASSGRCASKRRVTSSSA